MNFNAINGAAINGSAVMFNIILLPDGAFGIESALFERNVSLMAGSTSIGMSALGDISRLAQLGSAPFGIALDITGTLSKDQNIYLIGNLSLAMDATGNLNNAVYLAGGFTMALDVAGNPTNFAAMSATFGIDFAWDALLQSVRSLDYASFGVDLDTTGSLFVYTYLPDGGFGMALDMTADLASNPFADDPDDKVAVRQPQLRTADSTWPS